MKRLTVVLGPPVKVAATDDIIKDETDEHPERKVEGRRGRHGARGGEEERKIDVLEEADPELLVQNPLE
jgi:hypothetical protein